MEQNQQPQPPVFNQPQQPVQPQYQPRVTARPMMSFPQAVKTCLKKYANFKGRARRSEFWWFVLFMFIVYFLASFLAGFIASFMADALGLNASVVAMVVLAAIMLALVVPSWAVSTRRLHDTGRSGWWVAIGIILELAYCVSYTRLMWPILDKLDSTNPYQLASQMSGVMMDSPALATTLSLSGMALLVLFIIMLVFTVLDSKWTENKYGPSPKYQ